MSENKDEKNEPKSTARSALELEIPTPIHLRNIPWPAEIFDHPNFIASVAKFYRPCLFVEYGTGEGVATKVYAPYCKQVFGVDMGRVPSTQEEIPNLTFFKMSTREFKKTVLDRLPITIDMAFIDASHDSRDVWQDFEDLFPKMTENGIIFMHDTFPCMEEWATSTFSWDTWKVPRMIKEKYGNVCEVLTIPVQPGLTMVKKYTKDLDYMVRAST